MKACFVLILLASIVGATTFNFSDPGFDQEWSNQVKFSQAYAWAQTHPGSRQSLVMIADGWVNAAHSEFAGRMASIPGAPFDFTNEESYSQPGFNHGSEMAAIAAGGVNNGVGGVSTALGSPNVLLVSAKVMTANGGATMPAIKAALRKAATIPHLTVVNCSFGDAQFLAIDQEFEQIFDDLASHGTQVVVSAGVSAGQGSNLDLNQALVAFKNRHPNLIVVGANNADDPYPTSNYGQQIVDLVAPGHMEVLSFLGTGSHDATGPSVSTAEVSGALAFIRIHQPDMAKAKAALLLGAAKNQRPNLVGRCAYGVLDIYNSLQMLDLPKGLTLLGVQGADGSVAAVTSVTSVAGTFSLQSPIKFGEHDDGVTRLVLFAINWPTAPPASNPNSVTTAEAAVMATGQMMPLMVEDVRPVPGRPWLTQVTVKLDPNLPVPGNVGLTLVAPSGERSNQRMVALQ